MFENMKWSDIYVRCAVFGYAFFNVVFYFSKLELFFYLALFSIFSVFIFSITQVNKVTRRVVSALIIIAIALMIYGHATLDQWLKACNKNGLLIALFVFGNMLNLPFTYENYQGELVNVAKRYMKDLIPFCLLISIPTHIFGALTGFAAFSIMYHLFYDTAKLYDAEDIFISTLGRSYSTSGFWGTSWAGVMLSVSYLGLQWYKIILVGLIFTVISWGINLASVKLKMIKEPNRYPTLTKDSSVVVNWRNIWIMIILSVLIVGITLSINLKTNWDLMAIVPLVAMFLPPVVALVQKKVPEYKQGLINYFDKSLYKSRTESCLFFAAGVLGAALNVSGVADKIPGIIPDFLIQYPYFLVMALMLLLILPGQLGVHPVAVGTAMITSIVPEAIGLSVPVFAQTIMCAWLLSNMLSPFSGLNLTLSGLSGKTTFYTGQKLNWKYAVVCVLIYSGLVFVLGPLIG